MLEGDRPGPRRLPFSFEALGGLGRLALSDLTVGPLLVDRLELEVTDLGTDPGNAVAEKFQRRRTRMRSITLRMTSAQLEARVEAVRRHLASLGVSQLSARLHDGFVSMRARAAEGLAAADLSFRIHFVSSGTHLRALASTVRVHGHLPTPGPVIADRVLVALLAATDAPNVVERPHARGLCDVEIDLVGAVLWHLLPPAGWRLPAVNDIELVGIRLGRSAIEAAYGPAGTRTGELGVRPQTHQLAAAHDLMHSADQQLREGHTEEAMRGYRALLAAGGPEQPLLLERILALASARPAWFFDGLELSRQALGRWPHFPPAHAALASISLAQGDAREAAGHLTQLAQLASGDGDDDQAALAALAGARLLRVLEPRSATSLYELALEHDPSSSEAADSLADRYADEHRWPELVRLVRARAVITPEAARAVQLRLRLADVFVNQLGDPQSAQQELAVATLLAPDDPSVHEMTATILSSIDPAAAIDAWREVARLAEARGDHRTSARAWATVGDLLGKNGSEQAEIAWARALVLDPLQSDALAGLAAAAAGRGDHSAAADHYERLRGLGLAQSTAARHELALARSLVAVGRTDDARASLRRATLAGGETAAEAHAVLAEVAEAAEDRDHAAAELDTAIAALLELASHERNGDRLFGRAAELAAARAALFDRSGQQAAASGEWQRAHDLAGAHSPAIARDAARTMLARAGEDAHTERRWIDAVLATRPPPTERAQLLIQRAEVRRREVVPDLAAALADLHEALRLCEGLATNQEGEDPEATKVRRRAYQLEADILAQSGDQRARAQALTALAKMAERDADRIEVETAAAAAWLAADEPAAALPHGARAHAALGIDNHTIPPVLRREVLVTLGEAAWRQRAWPDVLRAYKGLIQDPGAEAPRLGTFRYRLAVAMDRTGDAANAVAVLRPIVEDDDLSRSTAPELRGQALRLFAEFAERAGDLAGAAAALEGFASLSTDSSPSARADAMYRAGELFRRAGKQDEAVRCLEAALRISDTHLPALDALEMAWRERGDNERVSVILGRKVAATSRHPARQKPLLSRLGDLQDQLGRPDVALAAHQRALEIDPTWRPSLRYVTLRLRNSGQLVAAAGGLAQLAGELPGDQGVDLAIVVSERRTAAVALGELIAGLDDAQLESVREIARPALQKAAVDGADVLTGLSRLRGEPVGVPSTDATREENTASGRVQATGGAISLREAASRARLAGKLDDALATLETANHVSPGDPGVLQELVELAMQVGDHEAAARHLTKLTEHASGSGKANAFLELAEIYYDHLDDPMRGRLAMRSAADAFTSGTRRDATLRMLASEARANLAWDIAVEAVQAIPMERRNLADLTELSAALRRAGKDGDAITLIEDAMLAGRLDDGGELLAVVRADVARKLALAAELEETAHDAEDTAPDDAEATRDEAGWLRKSTEPRTKTLTGSAPPPPPIAGMPEEPRPIGRIKLVALPPQAPLAAVTEPFPPHSERRPAGTHPIPNLTNRMPAQSPEVTEELSRVTHRMWAQPEPDAGATDRMPAQTDDEPTGEQPALAHLLAARNPTITDRNTPQPAVTDQMWAHRPDDEDADPAATDRMRAQRMTDPFGSVTGRLPAQSPEVTHELSRVTDQFPAVTDRMAAQPDPDDDDAGWKSVTDPRIESGPIDIPIIPPMLSVVEADTSGDRERLIAAHRASPDDVPALQAALAALADEPAQRRDFLDHAIKLSHGPALAVVLHELATVAREGHEMIRAAALWNRAHEIDPTYTPIWMPLADALAASDEIDAARELYEQVAASPDYDEHRRRFAAERADALGKDHTIVSGEIGSKPPRLRVTRVRPEIERARLMVADDDIPGAIGVAEEVLDAYPEDATALELLEQLYLQTGDITAASETIGRQLMIAEDEISRASLWRRRAKIYRDSLGRDAEAYRCLKEAHACSPSDPEISYQLRTAAMVRAEWALAASLLYREIAAATNPRERGALHLELALIFDERLDDESQAQVNFEQALAFDPTIPAAKLPLARRYEAIGRDLEAAKLYEEAATSARAADRAGLLEAAARCRSAAAETSAQPDLAAQLDRAEASGDTEAAFDLANQLWRAEPGHAAAFRVLANVHRTSGDLPALSDLTSVRASRAEQPDERATAWLVVARLAEDLRALDQAARAYDLALVEDPGHVGALDARGALAFQLGDFATADLIYRDLATGDSVLGSDELALRRSIICEHLGRDTEALNHAQRAADAAPNRREVMMRVQELATRIGDLETALGAARKVLDLIGLDDEEGKLRSHFTLVDLMRQAGDLTGAVGQLERILRDHPMNEPALEMLADVHIARADWPTATRYLYQLVPLAPTSTLRAERLYRLGEAVLIHLGDVDRADDVFLRASDLDPAHLPTLRRLLDVYWRADDPGALVEVATELADKGALATGPAAETSLAHALVAAALIGDTQLASRLGVALGDDAPRRVASALAELTGKHEGRLQLATASTAIAELARRGHIDLAKVRAAAAGTAVANLLTTA